MEPTLRRSQSMLRVLCDDSTFISGRHGRNYKFYILFVRTWRKNDDFILPAFLLVSTIPYEQIRSLQETIEQIKYDISSKRKSAALDGVKKAKAVVGNANSKTFEKIQKSCNEPKMCVDYLNQINAGLDPLQSALKASQDAFTGSEQERDALDKAYVKQQSLTDLLTSLQEQMIPKNYETPVPDLYSDLPQLKKRATVEMKLKKPNNGNFDVNGVNFGEAKLVMVIDGYTGMLWRCVIACFYFVRYH